MKKAERHASLTDSMKDLPVELEGEILLYTYVVPDGIGDLILQIRTYNELNKLYPGKVRTVTCCDPVNRDVVKNIVQNHSFPTEIYLFDLFSEKVDPLYASGRPPISQPEFAPDFPPDFDPKTDPASNPDFKFNPKDFDLIIVLSFGNKAPTSFYGYSNVYTLAEMNDMTRLLGEDVAMRSKQSSISFYPAGEGIWHDDINHPDQEGSAHLQASQNLKAVFRCPDFKDATQAKNWFEHTWISQSHCYNVDFFITTLLSQAGYVNNQSNDTERMIVKANLKDRFG